MDSCALCGEPAQSRCSLCKSARYCGSECQKEDWKSHKSECKVLRAAEGATAAGNAKPPSTHCTGCGGRFGGRIGERDLLCLDCGYAACLDCSCHNRRGTCYCENSNFGHKYCGRVPEWYHSSSRTGKVYRGDNHPDAYLAESHHVPASQWETDPRTCTNCGETKRCLKPGYQCTDWMCQ